jgi:hypothetical protein
MATAVLTWYAFEDFTVRAVLAAVCPFLFFLRSPGEKPEPEKKPPDQEPVPGAISQAMGLFDQAPVTFSLKVSSSPFSMECGIRGFNFLPCYAYTQD